MPEFRIGGLGGIAVAKLDSDSDVDLVYTRAESAYRAPGLMRALNDGTGDFLPFSSPPTDVTGAGAITAADFDDDAATDVAYVVDDGRVATQFGTGAASFSSIEWLDTLPSPVEIVSADVSADGVIDLVVGYTDEQFVSIFPGTGDGFGARQDIPTAIPVGHLALGDFNGDGVPDLFGFEIRGEDIVVLLSTP